MANGVSSIDWIDPARLLPYAKNARTHSPEQVAQIAASIQEFGFNNPILTSDDGQVIAGHGRLYAAQRLGLKSVPVAKLSHLTDTQRKAYVLADNRLALNAGWDLSMLGLELQELSLEGVDPLMLGFNADEVDRLIAGLSATNGLTDPDEAPEVTDTATSKLADVWLMGKHRLVCGDCTDALVVEKALNGVSPHLMVTDPPYGVEYDPSEARAASVDSAKGLVLNDCRADWREAWALFPGDIAYVWHAGLRAREVVESLESCDFVMRAQIIWDKTRPIMSRGHYHFQHEPCWYAVRKSKTAHWAGDRKQSTVWAIKHMKSETGHSTQKPVECMKRPIENNSSAGQAIYEPFSGSGTTIIAAEMTARSCHAIELSPQYVDVAVKRWQNFTGKEATLEASGKTFNELAELQNG